MRWLAWLALALTVAACGERGGQEAAPSSADTVAEAAAAFNPAIYDTVKWDDQAAELTRGEEVYKWACATCHGPAGRGDAEYVLEGDTLRPPSFQDPNWRFRDDLAGLRRYIFIGNAKGMPHWGLRRLRPRDIVALGDYIQNRLIEKGD
jgi:mono/diheme cytochrome c family protein